jgi:hypothetical protein
MAFPLRLERGDVDDDAATGIGALAQADGQHVARNAEVFDGAGQGEGVRRDDADVALDVDEAAGIEVFRVDVAELMLVNTLNSSAQRTS